MTKAELDLHYVKIRKQKFIYWYVKFQVNISKGNTIEIVIKIEFWIKKTISGYQNISLIFFYKISARFFYIKKSNFLYKRMKFLI